MEEVKKMLSPFSGVLRFLPGPVVDVLRLARVIWFPKEYEPELCTVIRSIVRPGWVCVDVGANIGVISHLLAHLVGPTGRVVAFEAFHKNAVLLKRMVNWSGLAHLITVENVAVSDGVQAEVFLFPGRASSSEEWNIVGHDVEGGATDAVLRIPATSLDAYFPPGLPLHFVKIDIEGAGAMAFRGMSRILREARPVLLIEFHDECEWRGREDLFSAGYDLYDMKGRRLDPKVDMARVYHCLACPAEMEYPVSVDYGQRSQV